MRALYFICSFFAAILSILIFGLILIVIVAGSFNILFPGLGIVVSVWGIIIFLAFLDLLFIALALIFKRLGARSELL